MYFNRIVILTSLYSAISRPVRWIKQLNFSSNEVEFFIKVCPVMIDWSSHEVLFSVVGLKNLFAWSLLLLYDQNYRVKRMCGAVGTVISLTTELVIWPELSGGASVWSCWHSNIINNSASMILSVELVISNCTIRLLHNFIVIHFSVHTKKKFLINCCKLHFFY